MHAWFTTSEREALAAATPLRSTLRSLSAGSHGSGCRTRPLSDRDLRPIFFYRFLAQAFRRAALQHRFTFPSPLWFIRRQGNVIRDVLQHLQRPPLLARFTYACLYVTFFVNKIRSIQRNTFQMGSIYHQYWCEIHEPTLEAILKHEGLVYGIRKPVYGNGLKVTPKYFVFMVYSNATAFLAFMPPGSNSLAVFCYFGVFRERESLEICHVHKWKHFQWHMIIMIIYFWRWNILLSY